MNLDKTSTNRETTLSDEESGSAFEISDNEQSHDDDAEELPASRAGSEMSRGRITNKSGAKKMRSSASEREQSAIASPKKEIFKDAAEWAANFQPPRLEDIKTPPRTAHGSKKKRNAPKPPTEARAKRLKSFYSNDYRELLNIEIQEAAYRVADTSRLQGSQIGASIWTAEEKATVFAALERLGRDDVSGIAERVGSKSHFEVQEYINLLHRGAMERKQISYQFSTPSEVPIAVEVSDECAAVLERAGDAVAAYQELAEEKVEKAKWGDSWAINQDVALQIGKRRRQEGGEEEIQGVFPAGNLLELSNWIELSERIFMNPGAPREEDNWQVIAEPGGTPMVRATAFEDFHSLAYNITKRLVSTALFCAMSRMRAKGSNKAKYADVNADDVQAAVNILRLKPDRHDFWRGVAKSHNLQVINDDQDENPVIMTYTEVENALKERNLRMRSRSVSRARSQARSEQPEDSSNRLNQVEKTDPSPPDVDQEDSDSISNSEFSTLPRSDEEYMSSPPPESISSDTDTEPNFSQPALPDVQEEAEAAQDAHTETCDMYASQTEEMRLWNTLKQSAPFEFDLTPVLDEAPKGARDAFTERENWRNYIDYVNEWEDVEEPVTNEEFAKNRRRISGLARRRAEMVDAGVNADADANVEDDDYDRDEEDKDGSGDHPDQELSQQTDLAAKEVPEAEYGGVGEEVDEEYIQVESPRYQSPD